MKRRTGSVSKRKDGTWWARVTFTDPASGKRREVRRRGTTKADACDLRNALLRALNEGKTPLQPRTFAQLAEHYEQAYARPPVYQEDRKVSGLRTFKQVRGILRVLTAHFGRLQVASITYLQVRAFREMRLTSVSRRGTQRSIARVNRELAQLRRLFRVAQRKGWVAASPMDRGEPLITIADERPRERILSRDEGDRLLAAASRGRRGNLRAILVCGLDTGLRPGEIRKLVWSDIDLERREIRVRAMNSKTLRERVVPITKRLADELMALRAETPKPDQIVFGIRDNVRKAFDGAKADAGIQDLYLHDLRHTAATRLVRGGMALAEVVRTSWFLAGAEFENEVDTGADHVRFRLRSHSRRSGRCRR